MYSYATRGLGFLVRCATISRQLGQGRQRSGGSPLFMLNICLVYMLCAKYGLGQSVDCPAQSMDSQIAQSMDCLDPYFAHGTIHGLGAQSTDYCAICGSIDCAGQSTDCPNPYFAHNIVRPPGYCACVKCFT